MYDHIKWSTPNGLVVCTSHLWLGAEDMFLANRKLRTVYSSSTSWERLTKAEAAEYPCETCESAEKKKAKTAEPAPAPAPVTKSGRIDHTACDHEKTASARKKCRDNQGKALEGKTYAELVAMVENP